MAASMATRVPPRGLRLLVVMAASPQQRSLVHVCRCVPAIPGRFGHRGPWGPWRGAQPPCRPHGRPVACAIPFGGSTPTAQMATTTTTTTTTTAAAADATLAASAASASPVTDGGAADMAVVLGVGGHGGDSAMEVLGGAGGGGVEGADAAVEATMADLGLGAATPVGIVQNLLESLHLDLGLPWWGAIVTGTLLVRVLVFPLMVKGQREAAKLNNFAPQLMELNKSMTDAKNSGNQFEFSKAHTELTSFYKKHKINPLKCLLVPMVQMPIFLSFFMALRKMAELPVPSMETGGALWFQNLTAADPLYLLPVFSTLTMLAVLELGAETGVDNPNYKAMKNVFRIVPIAILPLVASFPTAVFTYWLTSNVVSLVQVWVLRVGLVRRTLGIPERVRHAPGAVPRQGFISTIKKNWNDSKEAHRLKERERYIKHRLDIAAKAPLRQTFSQNPLQQQQQQQQKGAAPVARVAVVAKRSEVMGSATKGGRGGSKPWGDSLG